MSKNSSIELTLDRMTKTNENDSDRSSPDPNCSICLSKMNDKSFTDRCFHMFCFDCLVEWSKINAVCPLCKQPFKQIFHNIKSMIEYDIYDVLSHPSALPSVSSLQSSIQLPDIYQFHTFRTNLSLVMGFLSEPSNESAFSHWLHSHVSEHMRTDALQAVFVSDFIIDLLKTFNVSSVEFYQGISHFFGDRTSHFIQSLDSHLHSFIIRHYRHRTIDLLLQQNNRLSTNPNVERTESNRVLNLSLITANHRSFRDSTTSRHFIDGFMHSNDAQSSDPGPSQFSLLVSICRSGNSARNNDPHASSSSSSSPPLGEELIDIEQLDNSSDLPHHSSRSPICVSSGEEDQVQLVECSRTKHRHGKKRKHTTFFLVSSDDEATVEARPMIKRKKLKPTNSASSKPGRESKANKETSNTEEVRVTFKKHPTGHKNSLKKPRNTAVENQKLNDKISEEEKVTVLDTKLEGEPARENLLFPGSSSSLDPTNHSRTESASNNDDSDERDSKISIALVEIKPQVLCSVNSETDQVTSDQNVRDMECNNSAEQENSRNEIDIMGDDLVDVDTISVYSDDSIQLIDDDDDDDLADCCGCHPEGSKSKSNLEDTDVEVVSDMNSSDVIVVSSEIPTNKKVKRNSCRKRTKNIGFPVFVDLSDDKEDDSSSTHSGYSEIQVDKFQGMSGPFENRSGSFKMDEICIEGSSEKHSSGYNGTYLASSSFEVLTSSPALLHQIAIKEEGLPTSNSDNKQISISALPSVEVSTLDGSRIRNLLINKGPANPCNEDHITNKEPGA